MTTFVRLVQLYEGLGLTVQTSLNTGHFPGHSYQDIPFTYFFRDGRKLVEGGGISLAEIAFFEALFEGYQPRNIFIIGNAFGWSTIALALLNPDARIVAIDFCPTDVEIEGLEVTNRLGAVLGVDVRAVQGKSPNDVASIVEREFDGPINLAFIDGKHTNDAQEIDFNACRSVAAGNCVYVFHDVVNWLMVDGFAGIAQANPGLISSLLFRTPSGMAISYPPDLAPVLEPVVSAFTQDDERVRARWREAKESGGTP